jgi:SAM-dependent methyltransferase
MGDFVMAQPEWVPVGVDLERPNVARMYDYFLGGFHNFAPDRELAEQVIANWPDVPTIARANRAFLGRAVTHLVKLGVRQFLDIGSGVPTVGNVHEIAQALAPETRVVYVDVEPVAVAHSQTILEGNQNATVLRGDLCHPAEILADPALTGLLDLSRPTALLMVSVLPFVSDQDAPDKAIKAYREALGPGSYLVISHGTDELISAELNDRVENLYAKTSAPATSRSHQQILELIDGYDLLEPGLVLVEQWQPGVVAEVENPERCPVWAGIGRAR